MKLIWNKNIINVKYYPSTCKELTNYYTTSGKDKKYKIKDQEN